ncbi:VCBS repeat-containing protein [Acidobacteria bacterium AH-259-G07]|nr:VCBS repeat-containing protein [Acidobacteria bacterium AH-259-G07]
MALRSKRWLLHWVCFGLTCFGLAATKVKAQTWVEDTFEDLADGQLDASGQNLYISRDGKIRSIHRFDLNQDGYLDLVFNSNHDTYSLIPASLGIVTASRRIHRTELAVEGSTRVAVDDLNRDGYLDLVFCPNPGGVQHGRRFLTIIWGAEDGWPPHRSTGLLPTHDAKAIAITDLNGDGWPDIVALNGEAWLPGQPSGRIIRIFWGSQEGFLLSRRQDLGVPQAIDLAGADFDGDGSRDLAILTAENTIRFAVGRRE